MDCLGLDCESIYAAVINGGGWIHMTVKRRRSGGRSLHTAHLHCPRASHHGLMLHTGVYIANILPGSPAAREGSLAIGDRVLNVCVPESVCLHMLGSKCNGVIMKLFMVVTSVLLTKVCSLC